ncbi:MAG: hydroxyacid dehydrogenase [Bacteroidales bacterium]|nr:MAG: hydroxyacid dehydrogenase [Bacteroidales bacterium]
MNIVFAEPIGMTHTKKSIFNEEMLGLGHSVKYYNDVPSDQEELFNRSIDANILVVSNYLVSKEVVERLPNLKLIAIAFTGVDHIPFEYCKAKGIVVCNAAGYSTQAVAELTMALAISLIRNIVPFDKITRTGGTRNGFLGGELNGKTFGIVGFGSIGERVAKLALAFGCKVITWSRSRKDIDGVEFVQLEQLLIGADIISLHLPLNGSTKGLINEKSLGMMRANAILINTARGPIVDYEALLNALIQNKIAGAAIDVYENEPPIKTNHPLFNAPNTIMLPHIGFATHEAIEDRSGIVTQNIRNWMNGTPSNAI